MYTPQIWQPAPSQDSSRNTPRRFAPNSIYLADVLFDSPPKRLPKLPAHSTPLFVPTSHFLEGKHVYFRGETRSGKTQKMMAPLASSLIDQAGPIVLFDFKGDKELFHRVKRKAVSAGRTVRWFSPHVDRTYGFNPFQAVSPSSTRAIRIAGVWMEGLNQSASGKDSGDSQFFSGQGLLQILRLVQAAMTDAAGSNKQEITLTDLKRYLNQKQHQVEHATQVLTSLEQLSLIDQLMPAETPDHNIRLKDALLNNEVIIFSLPALGMEQVHKAIGGLALYTLVNALQELDENSSETVPRPMVLIDEWQVLAGQHVGNLLALLGSYATLVLSNQTSSQLNPDMAKLVWDNTFLKVIFNVSQDDDIQALQRESELSEDFWLRQENSGTRGGVFGGGRPATHSRSQYRDYLLTHNTIKDTSKHSDAFFVILEDGQPREPMICRRDHEVPFADHLRDKHKPIDFVRARFPTQSPIRQVQNRSAAPAWQALHDAPITGERAIWQAAMGRIWAEKEQIYKV